MVRVVKFKEGELAKFIGGEDIEQWENPAISLDEVITYKQQDCIVLKRIKVRGKDVNKDFYNQINKKKLYISYLIYLIEDMKEINSYPSQIWKIK